MKAIIPAAGYATRLYPLTKDKPKQLLDVGNKKMIEYIMDKIADLDAVDHVYIVTNDTFNKNFLEWKENYNFSKPISIINNKVTCNEERLGAIGDIHHAVEKANINDDLLVIAGDNLFELDLNDVHKFFKKVNNSVLGAKDLGDLSLVANRYGVVELDSNSKIIDFQEKPAEPKSALAATMIYMIKQDHINELFEMMENGAPDNAGEFIKFISEKGKAHSYVFNDDWYDIGSHDELERVSKIYKEK